LNTSGTDKTSTTYDEVDWHTGDDFPADLDASAARTHMGMFLRWAVQRGLESQLLKDMYPAQLHALRNGTMKGSEAVRQCCDDKLTSDDFAPLGNAFAQAYYEAMYLDDYVDLSDDALPSIYHEPDTAAKYALIRDLLDDHFQAWKEDNDMIE
jgi:hypothetical protein